MENEKKALTSITIQGSIIAILSAIVTLFDFGIENDTIVNTVSSIFGAIGGIMAIVGRIKAKSKIKL